MLFGNFSPSTSSAASDNVTLDSHPRPVNSPTPSDDDPDDVTMGCDDGITTAAAIVEYQGKLRCDATNLLNWRSFDFAKQNLRKCRVVK